MSESGVASVSLSTALHGLRIQCDHKHRLDVSERPEQSSQECIDVLWDESRPRSAFLTKIERDSVAVDGREGAGAAGEGEVGEVEKEEKDEEALPISLPECSLTQS